MGLAVTRCKGYCILCPVDAWVVSFQPGLSQNHIASCKFRNLECQGFQMLVDSKAKGTGMGQLILGFPSVNNNQSFWFRFQGQGQVVLDREL